MIRPPDEGDFGGYAGEFPHEIRHHQSTFLVELHENAAAVNQQRHRVRLGREGIHGRNLPLVAFQQIRTADTDCRKGEILKTIKLLNAALRQHRTKRRRNRNAPLGVDPVRHVR